MDYYTYDILDHCVSLNTSINDFIIEYKSLTTALQYVEHFVEFISRTFATVCIYSLNKVLLERVNMPSFRNRFEFDSLRMEAAAAAAISTVVGVAAFSKGITAQRISSYRSPPRVLPHNSLITASAYLRVFPTAYPEFAEKVCAHGREEHLLAFVQSRSLSHATFLVSRATRYEHRRYNCSRCDVCTLAWRPVAPLRTRALVLVHHWVCMCICACIRRTRGEVPVNGAVARSCNRCIRAGSRER